MKQIRVIDNEIYIEKYTDLDAMTCEWCDIPVKRKTIHGTVRDCRYHGNCPLPKCSYFKKIKSIALRLEGGM